MKDNRAVHYFDSTFQSQQAAKCDLLIRLSHRHLSYAIVDQLQDQLKGLFEIALGENPIDEITAIFKDHPHLRFNFRKVKVSIESDKFTFIPTEVFSESSVPAYSAFFLPDDQDEILITHLRHARVKNIISPPRDLHQLIVSHFVLSTIFSTAEPFIESALKLHFLQNEVQLFLHFNDHTFEALVTEGKTVLLYNRYDQQTADEFNYFLLLIFQETGILSRDLRVVVSGGIEPGDDREERLKKYVDEVVYADGTTLVRIPDVFESLSKHRYFPLLSLSQCE